MPKFSNVAESKPLDVLNYPQESHLTQNYDHPTKKPPTLTRDILEATTRPDGLVLIPFSGSGTEAEACERLRLDWIAFDTEKKYVDMTNERAKQMRHAVDLEAMGKPLPAVGLDCSIGLFAEIS